MFVGDKEVSPFYSPLYCGLVSPGVFDPAAR